MPHREADEEGRVPPVRLVTVATEVVLPRCKTCTQRSPLVVARATVFGDGLSAGVRDPPFPANPPHSHVLSFPSHVQPPFQCFSRVPSVYLRCDKARFALASACVLTCPADRGEY